MEINLDLILAIFILYIVLVLVIGFVASKFTKTVTDFFLAGRKLGSWTSAISSTASSESGWVVLGAVGMAYAQGFSAIWFVPGCLLGYVVNWYFIAPRFRRYTKKLKALTLPDFIEERFEDKSNVLRSVAVAIIFFSMMAYVGAQLMAAGKAFNAVFGYSYEKSVLIGAIIIIFYTFLGGFRAVSWTDLLQGLLMAVGLVILPIITIIHVGGFADLYSSLHRVDPNLVSTAGGQTGPALFGMIVGLFGIGLGYPGQPHVLTRYMATRSEKMIVRGKLIAISWGILVYYGAMLLGFCARILIPDIGDPEHAFPRIALTYLHPALAGVMLAAIMAAIMSTADSQLLVAASSVARDIYEKMIVKKDNEKTVIVSRIVVVVLGVCSIALALTSEKVIFWFVLYAWGALGASFGPLIILSLYSKKINKFGALAGMVTGFLVVILWKNLGLSEKIIYELVPGFILSFLAIIIVSHITSNSKVKKAADHLLEVSVSKRGF